MSLRSRWQRWREARALAAEVCTTQLFEPVPGGDWSVRLEEGAVLLWLHIPTCSTFRVPLRGTELLMQKLSFALDRRDLGEAEHV